MPSLLACRYKKCSAEKLHWLVTLSLPLLQVILRVSLKKRTNYSHCCENKRPIQVGCETRYKVVAVSGLRDQIQADRPKKRRRAIPFRHILQYHLVIGKGQAVSCTAYCIANQRKRRVHCNRSCITASSLLATHTHNQAVKPQKRNLMA